MKGVVLCLAAASAAAGVWAADAAVDGGAYAAAPAVAACTDDTLELGWDNGTRRWNVGWYTGAGSWVANDFDLATISTYRALSKIKFYTRSNWPNAQWDGFRVGVFNFSGSVPGSLMWPTGGGGYFFKPSGLSGHVWVEINVGWTCPVTAFAAAQEQFYNWPNCDPWAVDTNPTFLRHSWQYYGGSWSPLSSASIEIAPYYNLMLRVVVDNETLGVAPASLGRVKALYR
jgi:hypothetical protein